MKKSLLLLMALIAGATVWAENYITDVMVIGGTQTEVNNLKTTYTNQGWKVIDQDLNAGCGSGSDYIYLLYKQVGETTPSPFITDFVLTKGSSAPETITYNDCKYHLVKYDGGARFKETKGDLNSNAGGDYIHLYYTTNEDDSRCTAVKSITFNKTKDGAVVNKDTNEGYDLNSGAGGNYIYMHLDKAEGWIPVYNVTSSECYISGFDGPKAGLTYLNIPLFINGAKVLYFASAFNFAEFTNLETITFHENSVIDEMPSMKNCTKFKHVNTIKNGVVETDITPPAMKRIRGYVFDGTAIEKITLDQVNQIDSHGFAGCANLSEVNMNHAAIIESGAFANIPQRCRINYSGPSSDWSPLMYQCSPRLIVFAITDSKYMGWCGGTQETSHNYLYWTMDKTDKHLNIDCYAEFWEYNPQEQLITNHGWDMLSESDGINVEHLTMEHVDTIAGMQFADYTALETVEIKSAARHIGQFAFSDCSSIKKVILPSTVEVIRTHAFGDCSSMTDLYFEGTESQWISMLRESYWDVAAADNYKDHWRCNVNFETNGHGTAPQPQTNLWSNESKVQEPTAPSETGYTFIGWFTDTNLYTQWDFDDEVPGDMILYAKWMKRGDINADGKVDVSDVNITINLMLGKAQVNAFPGTADLNNDGKIDVSDVNIVINIMLGKE